MSKRKVRAWGFQKPGRFAFWTKAAGWLAQNKAAGREPSEWQDLATVWKIGASTLSAWKDSGQLPPVDCCVWLAARMPASLADLLDPNVDLGASKPADQAIRDWLSILPSAIREAIARGVKANPGAAARIVAGLDPSASLPG